MSAYRDNRGTGLEVGQEVAYNLSGEIAKGRIKSIKPGKQYWQKPDKWKPFGLPTVEVELLHNAAGHPAGKISKVNNSKNLLVLLDGEH